MRTADSAVPSDCQCGVGPCPFTDPDPRWTFWLALSGVWHCSVCHPCGLPARVHTKASTHPHASPSAAFLEGEHRVRGCVRLRSASLRKGRIRSLPGGLAGKDPDPEAQSPLLFPNCEPEGVEKKIKRRNQGAGSYFLLEEGKHLVNSPLPVSERMLQPLGITQRDQSWASAQASPICLVRPKGTGLQGRAEAT